MTIDDIDADKLDEYGGAELFDPQVSPWLLYQLEEWQIDLAALIFEGISCRPPSPPLRGQLWKEHKPRRRVSYEPVKKPQTPRKKKAVPALQISPAIPPRPIPPPPPPRPPLRIESPTEIRHVRFGHMRLAAVKRAYFERIIAAILRNGFTKVEIGTYEKVQNSILVRVRTLNHMERPGMIWIERTLPNDP